MSIHRAITPLRLIFWGGIPVVLDLTFSNTATGPRGASGGFRFDILNDFVGMLMIAIGVRRLSAFPVDGSYASGMRFVFVLAVLNCVTAFLEHFVFRQPALLSLLICLLALVTLFAMIRFCTCMRMLSGAFELHRSAASWQTTRTLVIAIWAIPLGLLYSAGILAIATNNSFHWDVGVLIIPILGVMTIPLFHLFVSTSRMRNEAATRTPGKSTG